MEYRLLGRSGLKISAVTMGTMTFGGQGWAKQVGGLGVSEAKRLVDLCLEAGVNLIDTANVYSGGLCEEIIGEILGGKRKDGVLLATKARFRMGEGPNDVGSSRQHLIAACEESLRRLKTDVIDLYQLHEWDGQTPLEETMEALDRLVRDGKVRYIGCSNFSGWHIMKALGVSERDNRQRFVSQQIHYTLEARDAEYELLPISVDQGLGVLVWSPLAGGLLSGKHRRDQAAPEGTRQFAGWTEPPIRDENRLWDIVDTLVSIAGDRGVSAAQVALAWLIGRKPVTSVIIGGRTEAQFKDNLAAADLKLTTEERKLLDDVSAPPVIYPYWHQLYGSDRLSEADMILLAPHVK
ncbi:aldo/keto reductase [Mesorhizobium sp.]|uniref:aldo/keto reductase n=1 Tax=Mesorhizobium sp. TaxID=1871066 RepID=UPI000FE717C5|nr:aldo/keto reductase [Mesorhizobium sp.]RWJ31932.1 MAG: aldo/keto reductase [Mesorhizobium sp.]TIQ73861.1 MAG: aldo/keto reductase [Mesorhizobium sp.]